MFSRSIYQGGVLKVSMDECKVQGMCVRYEVSKDSPKAGGLKGRGSKF